MEGKEREIPEKILLVKFGTNNYTKDGKVSTFDLTNEAADAIIREFTEKRRRVGLPHPRYVKSGRVINQKQVAIPCRGEPAPAPESAVLPLYTKETTIWR